MYLWYKLFTYLFYPIASFYLFLRKLKNKEHPTRYKEKLSKINIKRKEGFLVWFHVASVGEGISILPLIESLEKEAKIKTILITTITLSSALVLQKKLEKNKKIIHQFLPFDVIKFVDKFLNHWQPNLCIFIDSEVWPNLILRIKQKDTPLLLVNARITKKTFSRWKIISSFAKKIFEKFNLCIVSNNETENYLKILGANNIKNYGNLKFAKTTLNSNDELDIQQLDKFKNRKIWCAASTHRSEEITCAHVHLFLKKTYSNILTIIIPRHIDRIKKIKIELEKMNLKTCLFSKLEEINNNIDILLVDAYGESSKFFHISNYVFLGGSLIKHGGQNPIEPSRLGCKIFHGPYVNNFNEIYKYLESLKITNEVHNSEDLAQSLRKEFKINETKNSKIIEKIDNHGQNILNNVINDLKEYINI